MPKCIRTELPIKRRYSIITTQHTGSTPAGELGADKAVMATTHLSALL